MRNRPRTIVAGVLGVVTVLVLGVTIVAAWASATVLRREAVAHLVGDALAEPEVQTALATYVADQVAASVDLRSVLTNTLPTSLDRLAPVLASGASSVVERTLARVLENPDVQQGLVTLTERAHDAAMAILQGDGLIDGVDVADGQVTLNTLPLVARGLTALQSIGLLQDIDVPTLSFDGDPAAQAAELSAALGRPLPDGVGQLVVYESDSIAQAQATVEQAQRIVVLAKRALVALLIATVVLVAATILVAPRRWRAVLVLGAGTAAAMVVLRSAARRVVEDAPDLVERAGARAAVDAIVSGASTSLLRLAGVMLLAGLVAVVVALLAGGWQRADLVLVGAVAAGTAAFAVLGFSVWSVLVGVLVGVAVALVARRLWPPAGPADAAPPTSTMPSAPPATTATAAPT